MGFSAALQGKAAHEALLLRQDAELRLLDLMRRCIHSKVRSDRDYALALGALVQQGLKVERPEDLAGSLVAKAWRGIMEELDNTGRAVRQNAESLEKETLEKLNTLYTEKRKARKNYQEEHSRIAQQFTHLSEDVARKKTEYTKALEAYKITRGRFEEHYIKAGRGGRKLEDVSAKYQNACRKLHLTHNEYVLLLSEASEFERDFRTVLLPGLLECQQSLQEGFISSWRSVLQELAKHSNLSDERFVEIQNRMNGCAEQVRPSEEYKDFTEKHKTCPANPVNFTFDESLVEDSSSLLANTLAVDNLTIDWLRHKQIELEARLRDNQERQVALRTAAAGAESSGGSSPEVHRLFIVDAVRKELNEVRCEEHKISRQAEVIKNALASLGCEEAPPGCDIPLESSFIETSEQLQDDPSSLVHKRNFAQQRLVSILRKPFRRKSVPTSPVGARRNNHEDIGSGVSNGVEVEGDMEQLDSVSTTRTLADEEWFHGVLPREEVVRLLKHEGDFLVRQTTRNDECQTVLSVSWGGHKHFIVQTTAEGQYRFEGPAFPTISALIAYQYNNGQPVTSRSGAILRHPIPRERWELNNDDIVLQDKIGRGNFGDVYKAQLKPGRQEVAVKTCRVQLPEDHKRKFLQEGRILKQYDHPNIVRLIGIAVQKQPIMIVMELVPGGSLLVFLRNHAAILSEKQLVAMCRDVAGGMRYLESKNCIHRDLAARNCLVGHENIVKISDFGMSREEEEYIVSDGMKQIPIKWTAPEALNFGKYTSLCDVWSYGILCWEVFSRGGTPYAGFSNTKAREKIDAGYRMPSPDGTPEDMYRLMLRCWETEPQRRPHFHQIYTIVDTLYGTYR
ncbi:tyrosine-protein kinase Fer isoform X2 [Thrips palmi]|uniref:Tyrosine-protein kinase n=1 Tax=Thrips palmi TaxID=161013 RepID=A0A6P8ZDA7_THRPL|nr:tyrosine-protein kinase Fer isoform X2 [Thrips palmi]